MSREDPTVNGAQAGAPILVHGSPAFRGAAPPQRPPRFDEAIQGATSPTLVQRIERRIRSRTGERIRDLSIQATDDRIELHGYCATFYTKQLAQHAAMGVLENEILVNLIAVGPLR